MTDEELLSRFESCTLTHADWNHRSHVRIAFMYLREHGLEDGLNKIRSGIKKLNAVHQVPESETRGYNETTTRAFAQIIFCTIQAYGEAMPTPNSESFCDTHPHLMQKTLLRCFYSPERRMHPDAKHTFIEPDLTALPTMAEASQAG